MTTQQDQSIAQLLLAEHSPDGRRDCGALTDEMPCNWSTSSGKQSTHIRHCTLDPGHDTPHKDQSHCWSFETFTEDQVIEYQPRDLSRCLGCHKAGINSGWPCLVHRELTRAIQELQIDLPAESRPNDAS